MLQILKKQLYIAEKCCNIKKKPCCYKKYCFWLYIAEKCCNIKKKRVVTNSVKMHNKIKKTAIYSRVTLKSV